MSDTPESPWRKYVRANLLDGSEDGSVTLTAKILLDELVDIHELFVADSIEDRGIHVETYETSEWETLEAPVAQYRWRVRHSNGEVMGSGEGYTDARDRDHAVQVLFPGVPTKEVEG